MSFICLAQRVVKGVARESTLIIVKHNIESYCPKYLELSGTLAHYPCTGIS